MPTTTSTTHHDLRRRLLDVLKCPLCDGGLELCGRSLRCTERHTFDIARHGYVSLLTGTASAASADTASMVQAREAFLRAGHYAPLARALAVLAAAGCRSDGTVLDAGTGTGYYLAAVLDALPEAVGLGLDASKFALRRAARAHSRGGNATWDIWRPLPVRTEAVDMVLNVFAPRNGPEFHRVLRPGGILLVATPTSRHLSELRRHLDLLSVDAAKEERLHRTLDARFRREHTASEEYGVTLNAQEVYDLASMGPAAHHTAPDELRRRVDRLDGPVQVTASFRLSVYRAR
jgi:23S rRNA (guanine745-N1)-methyltransferase